MTRLLLTRYALAVALVVLVAMVWQLTANGWVPPDHVPNPKQVWEW